MTTLVQWIKKRHVIKKSKSKRPALQNCPHKKATCLKVFNVNPRKPNSALRKVSWVMLSNFKRVHAYIPGIGHSLQKHSIVLVRGGKVKDLPGVKYTLVRGVFDLKGVVHRRQARSKYGVKIIYGTGHGRYKKFSYW